MDEANHPPIVKLAHANQLTAVSGETVELNAAGTSDPDGNQLNYRWWQYSEADTYPGTIEIANADKDKISLDVPGDAKRGQTIHVVCEVTDSGSPTLTRYQRVVVQLQ